MCSRNDTRAPLQNDEQTANINNLLITNSTNATSTVLSLINSISTDLQFVLVHALNVMYWCNLLVLDKYNEYSILPLL